MQRAKDRAAKREADNNPAQWGIGANVATLPANVTRAVERIKDEARRGLIYRRSSDAFVLLKGAGGLTPGQFASSERYWLDWCESAGVRTTDTAPRAPIDGAADSDLVTVGMIDARSRVMEAHHGVGRATAMLLTELVEPLAMRGEIKPWRDSVQRITGETERHSQATAVRRACESLRLAYEDIDAGRRRPRPVTI